MSDDQTSLNDEEYKRLKRVWDEQTLTERPVELKLTHNGHVTVVFSRLRKILRVSREGKAIELWETEDFRESDRPIRIGVCLDGDETLAKDFKDTGLMGTEWGSNKVSLAMMLSMISVDIVLLLVVAGVFGIGDEFYMNPFFLTIIGSAITAMAVLGYIKHRVVAKIIDVECGVPLEEHGGVHFVIITGSRTKTVVQQVDAIHKAEDIFKLLSADVNRALTKEWDTTHVQNLMLQAEINRIQLTDDHGLTRKAEELARPGRSGQIRRSLLTKDIIIVAILGIIVLAAVAIYLKGGL
jgi:hypothetical protein